ncbi:MAG: hypothetical protein OEM91_13615 [Hyphomicrobiales bacterium]|nr:hypothetical protein [Hyphomicrobiales bacterium]
MTRIRTTFLAYLLWAFALVSWPSAIKADPADFCVTCSEPRQTYVCRVDTPRASPGDQALQLYCMVRTAKDGGHKSCSIERNANAACNGPVKAYVYDGPAIPEALRSAAQQFRQNRPGSPGPSAVPNTPVQKGGEPDTLVKMTTRAVDASKDGVKSTGGAVKNAAGKTGKTIGKVGKKAGSRVGKTARGAKSAARYAYDCVFSLFRDCSAEKKAAAQ